MTAQEIFIGAIGCNSFAVIVEGIDLAVWERNTVYRLAPTVFTIGIFIYIVSEVDDIVDGILSHRIAVGIEEAECFGLVNIDNSYNSARTSLRKFEHE
jgi:hypothetical protein